MPPFHCRKIIEEDWPAILRIQSEAYYEFAPESETVMRSKAIRSPNTCFVVVEQHTSVIAYCLAYSYPHNRVAALGDACIDGMNSTDNLYLHDLAVQKASFGRGIAHFLLDHVTVTAKLLGYQTISLVAVQNAAGFWAKQGFQSSDQAVMHESYCPNATFMVKSISANCGRLSSGFST